MTDFTKAGCTVEAPTTFFSANMARTRETREGWPLLTVETDTNGDCQSTNESGPSQIGLLGSSYRYDRFLSCLGCTNQANTKYYLPHRIFFHFSCPQRDRERRPYTPCGPASWTMGTDNLKLCTIGKKLFCTGPTGSAVQFFMLPLPSKIHRLNSVSTGNEPVNIKQGFKFFWGFGPKLVSCMSYVSLRL